jgi:hypothetical protein
LQQHNPSTRINFCSWFCSQFMMVKLLHLLFSDKTWFCLYWLDSSQNLKATCHKGAWGERRYSSYSFSTSALDGNEWSVSCPSRTLTPEKEPLAPIVQEAGWAPEPVWTQRLEEKSFSLCQGSNLNHLVVQPIARH